MNKWFVICIGSVFFSSLFVGCIGDENTDSDGDSISDSAENAGWDILVYTINGTVEKRTVTSNPNKKDSDGDGINDNEEMNLLSDPSNADTDHDGLSDNEEIESESSIIHFDSWLITTKDGTRRVFANYSKVGNSAIQYDSDFDGLSDSEEYKKGSDPSKADTDNDGDEDFIDPSPCWNLKIKMILKTFELKKNMDVSGGANLYFVINIGDETMSTEVRDISLETVSLNEEFIIDFPDRNAHIDNKLNILISAIDEDSTSLFGDTPIKIDDSKESYNIQYDIKDTSVNEFTTSGDEGELTFSCEILKT